MKRESSKKIAILFHDNDFYYTFSGVLKALLAVWQMTDYLPKDKKQLTVLINALAAPMYLANQNCWQYNGLDKINPEDTLESDEYLHIKKWVTITPDKILIDEEVDDMINTGESDGRFFFNGEYFVLDTTFYSDQVYSC